MRCREIPPTQGKMEGRRKYHENLGDDPYIPRHRFTRFQDLLKYPNTSTSRSWLAPFSAPRYALWSPWSNGAGYQLYFRGAQINRCRLWATLHSHQFTLIFFLKCGLGFARLVLTLILRFAVAIIVKCYSKAACVVSPTNDNPVDCNTSAHIPPEHRCPL